MVIVAQEARVHEVTATANQFDVVIDAPAGCGWTARTESAFVSIGGAGSGTGPGAIHISVAENTGGQRSGEIHVGTVTISVVQAAATAACAFDVSPSSVEVAASGGSLDITIGVSSGQDCVWTAEAAASYVSIEGSLSRTGPGVLRVYVSASPGPERIAIVNVAGQVVHLRQAAAPPQGPTPPPPAAPCEIDVTPTAFSVPPSGGAFTVTVTASRPDCAWTIVPGATFVTTSGPLERVGSGSASITVDANTGAARTGTASVAGRTITLTQAAVAPVDCLFALSPASTTVPPTGGTVTLTVSVVQGTNCSWRTRTLGDGVTIVSGSQGVGPGTVVVSIGPNPGTFRWTSIFVENAMASIRQAEIPGVCVFALSPATASISARAQKVIFDVVLTTGSRPHCNFTLNVWRDDPMIVEEEMDIIGNNVRVTLTITENTSTSPRNSLVTIVGIDNPMRFTVFQAGR